MTVAIIAAAVVSNAAMNVNIAIGRLHHLDSNTIGDANAATVFNTQPAMKNAVATLLAILTNARIFTTSAGKAMVEPGRSSFRMMAMGLNQNFTLGCEQDVIPSSLYPSQKFQRPTW